MVGIVICSRTDSKRIPNKPLVKINGKEIIAHLIDHISSAQMPIYVAIPEEQKQSYDFINDRVQLFTGYADDPLRRMYECAKKYELDPVIRITHDKILVDPTELEQSLELFYKLKTDYAYPVNCTPGTGFEIISFKALEAAALKFEKVEHISYAVKSVIEKEYQINFQDLEYRFLIDYPEDITFLEIIFSQLGNNCSKQDVIDFLYSNGEIAALNKLPEITIYTCVFNGEKYLKECIESIVSQRGFENCEYIIIDDFSTDSTPVIAGKYASKYSNIKLFRNEKNIGLASSSNVALKHARGEFILRVDADDLLLGDSLDNLYKSILRQQCDIVYPDNLLSDTREVQKGNLFHHVGGSIFKTRAVNHIKFTEGLRGYEGYDFFVRAQMQLKIGYLNMPTFIYRQHADSMSKINLEDREKIKSKIDEVFLKG